MFRSQKLINTAFVTDPSVLRASDHVPQVFASGWIQTMMSYLERRQRSNTVVRRTMPVVKSEKINLEVHGGHATGVSTHGTTTILSASTSTACPHGSQQQPWAYQTLGMTR